MKLIYSIIGMIALMGCSAEITEKTTKATTVSDKMIVLNQAQIRNSGIELAEPVEQLIGATVRVSGTVEVPPQNKTAISFPFGGFVKSIPVLDGMNIKKGQVLITLEDPTIIQLQQDYLEAMSQLEFLQLEYERQKSLSDQQINSGKVVQQAKSNFLSTQARCKGMKLKLEMAGINPSEVAKGNLQRVVSIRSPFNGVVTKMNAAVGHYATPQEVLLEIIDLKHCHIELSVFEKDIASLKIGQRVHVTLMSSTDVKQATIYLIGKEISMERTVKVHCHLDNEDASIIPGGFVQAEIDLTSQKQLTVPSDAVVNLNGKTVVFHLKNTSKQGNTYEAKEVEVLGEENGRTAFRYKNSQDSAKQPVVVKGAYAIVSAIVVKMEPEE